MYSTIFTTQGTGLISIGTSAQFSAILPANSAFHNKRSTVSIHNDKTKSAHEEFDGIYPKNSLEVRPYFNGKKLVVAASLTGGNALATFVRNVQDWALDIAQLSRISILKEDSNNSLHKDRVEVKTKVSESDMKGEAESRASFEASRGTCLPQSSQRVPIVSLDSVYSFLNRPHNIDQFCSDSSLTFDPRFFGERSSPKTRASIGNIQANNFTLQNMWVALQQGVVENLYSIIGCEEVLEKLGITRIHCVGGYIFILKQLSLNVCCTSTFIKFNIFS